MGLVVNLMAGRDIRRLVAGATLHSTPEKALAAFRILAGVTAVEETRVVMMDDADGFGAHIRRERSRIPLELVPESAGSPWEQKTTARITRLVEAGADVVVVVGGDGTQRNAAQADPPVPILPVAGGTNNVACWVGDQTAAGFVAGCYARGDQAAQRACSRMKAIHVASEDGREDMALIDAAWVRQPYTGAEAVWDAEDVRALFLAVADGTRPGLSNVGGQFHPVAFEDDRGVLLEMALGPEEPCLRQQMAVLAPGLMAPFRIKRVNSVALGEPVVWQATDGGTIALDGERAMVLKPGERVTVTVRRDGPVALFPDRVRFS